MKKIVLIIALALSIPAFSQTKVIKRNAVKANDFGISYYLPKTLLTINAEVTKVSCKAGPYYQYAEKYLGVKDVVIEDQVYYELGKVSLENKGVPDESAAYIISFKSKTVAPFAYLTEDGLLCSINAEFESDSLVANKATKSSSVKNKFNSKSVLSEELLMAGSTARQAEVAAKQIYRIRESRMNILTGEADNLPPDGDAMKLVIQQLDQQEEALTQLFTGIKVKENQTYSVDLEPQGPMDKQILFRFSKKLGIVDVDDLGGAPIYINMKVIDKSMQLDPKELEKKEKQMKGIVYNVPGKASIDILFGNKSLFKGDVMVTQFGYKEELAPVMLEDKKAPVKVYFYPQTGAIKQIIQ